MWVGGKQRNKERKEKGRNVDKGKEIEIETKTKDEKDIIGIEKNKDNEIEKYL
jgi:hypothetical protein